MDEVDQDRDGDSELAEQFQRQRPQLRAVAVRLLGSSADADDAVQDAWLRASRSDRADVINLGGWLTTIVARVCLTRLQTRRVRPEQPIDEAFWLPAVDGDPEHDAVLADAVGGALLVVLDTLAPAERLAFVLHDLFAMPFQEVARVLNRTPVATRQLASRARRRVAGNYAGTTDRLRAQAVVRAFLSASREGRFADLLAILDPDVMLSADTAAVQAATAAAAHGALPLAPEIRGAAAVAHVFSGRAQAARPALIDGLPGLVWAPADHVRAVFDMLVRDGRIMAVEMVADPAVIRQLSVELL